MGEKDEGIKKYKLGSPGQDGGTGRNPSLPGTTKRKVTTNLKTINKKKEKKKPNK